MMSDELNDKLSDRMALPIDGPLFKPLMTISEGTVRAWADEVAALEARFSKMEEALDAAIFESIANDATAASVGLVIRVALKGENEA
jgi:hypothetical protein